MECKAMIDFIKKIINKDKMGENVNIGYTKIPKFLNSTAKIVAITAILYFLIAKLSLFIFVTEINILPFFPAIGFAIAMALIYGRKAILGVAIGCLVFSIALYKSDFQNASTFEEFIKPLALCIIRPIIACLNTFLVSYFTQMWCKSKYPFNTEKNVILFAFASLLGTFISVSIGFIPFAMTPYISLDNCILIWSNMLRGNALGIILFTPFVLSWLYNTKEFTEWTTAKKTEAFLLILSTLSLTLYTFESHANNESILFFLLIWAACRFGMKIITLVSLIITIIAIYCTGHHMGGFIFSGWNSNFLMLQLFLFVNMVSILFLKAILEGKKNEANKLKISEQNLGLEKDILKAAIESPKGISISSLDTNLNYLSFNSTHAKYMKNEYGVDIEIGKNHIEYITKENRKEEINSIYQTVLKGSTFSNEEKDATGQYWTIYKSPIKNQERKIIGTTTIVTNITDLKLKEIQLEKNNYSLNERIKELNCLYSISELFRNKAISKSKKLESCLHIIPTGMQFPEITNCRIQLKEKEFVSANYQKNEWLLKQLITVNGEEIGNIEVSYLDREKSFEKNPFLDEEIKLLEAISGIISKAMETKMADEKLIKSEESYRTLFENVQDVFFKTCLRTNTILEVSPSCSSFNQIKREELIGQSIFTIYPDTEQLELMTQKMAMEQELVDYNNEIIIKGKRYYVSINAKILFDADGKPEFLIGALRNVTERRLAEENLKISEEKFRAIYESFEDIYFKKDLDGTLLDVSPSVEKHFNIKRELVIGQNAYDFYVDRADGERFYETVLQNKQVNDYEERLVTGNGEIVYFSINAKVVYNADGEPAYYEGTMRNANERVQNRKKLLEATEKIKESEEKYRSIFENTQDVYYMHNLDGKIFEVSPSCEKHFKYTREEMMGIYTGDLYYDPSKQNEFREKITRDGFINDEHVQFVTETGEPVYFSVNCKIIFDKDGTPSHIEGSMRNINDRILNQQKLIVASERIKESEEKFRTIYENMHDVYFMHELDGTLIDISPSAEKNFPTKRENLIGLNVQSFYCNPARFDELSAKLLQDSFLNDQEVQFLTTTGEIVYFSVSARLTYDRTDNRTLVEGTMRNINERIANQQQLAEATENIKQSEEKFRSIYENIEDVYFLHELDGTILDISPSGEKAFNMTREELIGGNALVLHSNPAKYHELIAKMHIGPIYDEEVQFFTATGESVYFSANAKLVLKKDCNCFRVEGTMRDITERVINQKQLLEATEKIKESEQNFRSLFDNMQDIYFMHTLDGKIFEVSPAVEKHLKYKREEMIGSYTQDHFHDPLKQFEIREKLIKNGYLNDEEIQYVTATGEPLYFSLNSRIKFNLDGTPSHIEGSIRNINERILNQNKLLEATEKIRQSEEEFRAIFESFEDLYYRVSLDGYIQNVSPSVEKILKYTREEIINTSAANLYLNAEDRTKILDTISEKGHINDLETIFKDKQGNSLYVSLNAHLIYDSKGNAMYIEGTIRDVSQRKQNELEIETANVIIRESEKKYRTIFESVRDVFFRASAKDHTIIDISPSCSYFDMKPDEIIGKTIDEFYQNPADRKPVLKELMQNGELKNYDVKFLLKSKTYNVSINSKIVFDKNNEPEFIIGSFRDVTARIKAEENLKISEAKFRSIYENFEDIYFKSELDTTIIDLSPSFEKHFKMKRSDVIGSATSFSYYNPEDRKKIRSLLKKNGHISDFDTRYIDGEGNIVAFSISAHIVYDSNGDPLYVEGTMRNINERSIMQEEMLEKNRTLEFQNIELEQFAYIASHDLQEPLITVIHCIELLQEGLDENLDEDQKQYLQFINSSTSRMQLLVKGLLDYSRIGKGRKNSQIDCNEIVSDVLADMNASLTESNAIVEYENLPVIEGYTTEIRQLFQNMISNANKYRKKDQQPKIKIAAVKEENSWLFSIQDNGIGIEEQNKDKVFVIFKRLHNRDEYQGTGIGLSHCKKIVEHHKGKIWVESKFNEGSTFKWTFPMN